MCLRGGGAGKGKHMYFLDPYTNYQEVEREAKIGALANSFLRYSLDETLIQCKGCTWRCLSLLWDTMLVVSNKG